MAQLGRISGQLLRENLLRDSNLNFKNTVTDTALLHFDIQNRNIGINTESPSDALEIPSTAKSTNLIANYSNISNISLQYITDNGNNIGNEIVANTGDLFFRSGNVINISSLSTDSINFNNNVVSTYTANEDLEIRPNGNGKFVVGSASNKTELNITGSLHSTGDIIFGADLVLGNDSNDSVNFEADVNSDIVPDQTNQYNLGSAEKSWQDLHSNLLNGTKVTVSNLNLDDVSLARRQGNIFYVSTLGDDSNVGDHQHGAFRTLKHALEVVDASSAGPVIVHVFPGEYQEELPLTVPERVTISGEDIRNTIIKPTFATETNSVFLLNQNCTVENITIKDFYSPGYAFEFAPDAIITERSPYVRNISVITKGSVTSSSDPRGFDSGDAGSGALVNGAVVNDLTENPSMLFHNTTFITPGVNAIEMTNGVRVEWLNSFTYFANIGLYAFTSIVNDSLDGDFATDTAITESYDGGDATTESTTILDGGNAGSAIEIRSIGSACVYGNFGAVAEGSETLMYLIGHNFAYIGSGKDVSNDRTLTLYDQETVEINQGKIYYTSTDADGTFRIGDAFFVDFEDGTTSIDIDNIDFSGVSSIVINDGGNITYIDGSRIDIGNIRFSGNTVFSLDGDIIFKSATLKTIFDTNPGFKIASGTTAQRKLEQSDFRYNTDNDLFEGFSTANTGFAGVYSDDQNTFISANNLQGDIVFVADDIETARISGNNINLDDSSIGQIGNVEFNGVYNGNILVDNNVIRTTESNSDLELLPNGASYTNLEDLSIYSNIIENFKDSNFSIAVTDQGYVKFDTSGGMVIPFGTDSDRPETPEVGDTRWNTEQEYLEVYTGTEWQRAAGTGEEVTEDLMKEIVDIYTLVLG